MTDIKKVIDPYQISYRIKKNGKWGSRLHHGVATKAKAELGVKMMKEHPRIQYGYIKIKEGQFESYNVYF